MTVTILGRTFAARTLLTLAVICGASTLLGACSTTAGLGKDVSATGHAVTNSAEKVKQGL